MILIFRAFNEWSVHQTITPTINLLTKYKHEPKFCYTEYSERTRLGGKDTFVNIWLCQDMVTFKCIV